MAIPSYCLITISDYIFLFFIFMFCFQSKTKVYFKLLLTSHRSKPFYSQIVFQASIHIHVHVLNLLAMYVRVLLEAPFQANSPWNKQLI